jgi:hypothetical protein
VVYDAFDVVSSAWILAGQYDGMTESRLFPQPAKDGQAARGVEYNKAL